MNFTLVDILLSGWAFLLYSFFLIPPGYALGWALDLVSFRKQDAGVRFLLSIPLSIALMPIVVYLIGRYSFDWPVWTIYGVLFGVFFVVCRLRGLRIDRIVWIASACWIAVAFLSLVDLQLGKKLYYSVVAYDLNFRSVVTGAFARAHVLPITNPFFSNGTVQPFRYHYFWFMYSSLPVRLSQLIFGYTGLTARHAVIASAAWAGLAMFSVVALFGKFFFAWEEAVRSRIIVIALMLFGLSGLDIVPALLGSWDGLYPSIDWWNGDQVTTWLDTMLWVPHALASLVACLTGFLVLWTRDRLRWQDALAAGVAFASAVGLSVYVTLTFAVFATVWTLRIAIQRDWRRAIGWAASGVLAAGLALPFLRELAGNPGAQGSFLVLQVRHFSPILLLLDFLGKRTYTNFALANLLCLPLNYFLEFGFFAIAGIYVLRRKASTPADAATRLLLFTGLGFCSVVRSNTIQMNDLGARGMLIPQFVLLIWGAVWLSENGRRSWLVKLTLGIGIVTSAYELLSLRFYPILADNDVINGAMEIDPDPDLGLRDFSARQIYRTLNRVLPASAVVQHNPSGAQDLMAGLYANRQFALMDLGTAIVFTGDRLGPELVLAPLAELFAGTRNDPLTVCRQLGIDVLVVKNVDPVWQETDSWMAHLPVLAKADLVEAFDCRGR